MQSIKQVDILGTPVSAIDMPLALETMRGAIAADERVYITVANVHSVMTSYRDARLRAIHAGARLVTPDGMPLVWVCHWRGYREVSRVYGPDLLLAVCESLPDARHFFYGGAPGVAAQLVARLRARFPGLQVAGIYSPAFREAAAAEDPAIIDHINAQAPDIIWVGLGNPKQEIWMADHRAALTAPVIVGVGAAFDFHAGVKRQAPRWMMRLGLEWLFRLMSEPRRLWRRYLINNPQFIVLMIKEWILGKTV
jgi:N-acetylglucosaminyldiphosphoundecaprenol N-acetyl-beta-D-mannosaminyltransferase